MSLSWKSTLLQVVILVNIAVLCNCGCTEEFDYNSKYKYVDGIINGGSYNITCGSSDEPSILPLSFESLELCTNCTATLTIVALNGTTIPAYAFKGISEVKILNLTNLEIDNIQLEAFDGLKNLTDINLQFNKISRLEKGVLDSLVNSDYAVYLDSLDLRHNNIKSVRDLSIFNNYIGIDTLRLDFNYLEDIDTDFYKYFMGIDKLYLSNNKLSKFDFSSLHFLNVLSISNNKLTEIRGCPYIIPNLFLRDINLSSLKTDCTNRNIVKVLDISLNPISNINEIAKFTKLEKLYLEGLKIQNLPVEFLSNFKSLQILDLSHNELSEINPEHFNSLSKLSELYIHKNPIKNIPPETFKYLKNLKSLDLSATNIENLNVNMFSSLDNLISLNLTYNHIRNIPIGIFVKNNNLKYLNLSHNEIEHLYCGSLEDLNFLEVLDISFNNITVINACTFSSLEALSQLHLEYNKLTYINVTYVENLHVDLYLDQNMLSCNNLVEIVMRRKLAKGNTWYNTNVWGNSCYEDPKYDHKSFKHELCICNYVI